MRNVLTRNVLTLVLCGLFLALGIGETVRSLSADGASWYVAYWAGSLIGGAVLVLAGRALLRSRPKLAIGLVVVGCLAGANATVWTLAVPVLAVAVIALTVRDADASVAPVG